MEYHCTIRQPMLPNQFLLIFHCYGTPDLGFYSLPQKDGNRGSTSPADKINGWVMMKFSR